MSRCGCLVRCVFGSSRVQRRDEGFGGGRNVLGAMQCDFLRGDLPAIDLLVGVIVRANRGAFQ